LAVIDRGILLLNRFQQSITKVPDEIVKRYDIRRLRFDF
jgi:hypothetical protein